MENDTATKQDYATWPSIISPQQLVEGKIRFDLLKTNSHDVYWSEARPSEQGRCVLQKEPTLDLIPSPYSAKSRVHEYGGGTFCVNNNDMFFVNEKDQQIYQLNAQSDIKPITQAKDCRFADLEVSSHSHSQYIIAICEQHLEDNAEPINSIVAINTSNGMISTIAEGQDFYAFPRFNADASKIAWIAWNHPHMQWDQSSLHLGQFNATSGTLESSLCIISDENTSVFQPSFSPDGTLFYVSDQSGWWNLYSELESENAIIPQQAEYGRPVWVFGLSTYCFVNENLIACSAMTNAQSQITLIHLNKTNPCASKIEKLNLPYSDFDYLCACNQSLYCVASSGQNYQQILKIDVNTQTFNVIKSSSQNTLDPTWISIAQEINFPSANSDSAYGFYYPPCNPNYVGLDSEKPPLIVLTHGGPTTYVTSSLNLGIQFWTSRGFAVFDLNYRGSTGFGRDYRNKLVGQWGIADIQDCEHGANYLADQGLVDCERLLIRGGSAGGYTTLCALTFGNTFKAGASYYGISDLLVLAQDTHKFEARYLDSLVGPLPKESKLYHDRSPIHFVNQINCPIIFLQGLKDNVVPPSQSEKLVNALREKKLAVAYITYENERHGFRDAKTIIHAFRAELYFYQRVLNLTTETNFSIEIENLALT